MNLSKNVENIIRSYLLLELIRKSKSSFKNVINKGKITSRWTAHNFIFRYWNSYMEI